MIHRFTGRILHNVLKERFPIIGAWYNIYKFVPFSALANIQRYYILQDLTC